jgi:cobalt-zinc-cadmium efflux system outer membrane protein
MGVRCVLGLLLITFAQAAPADELGTSLDGLLNYAREHNPELRMRMLEASAAHAGAEAASALPDPNFQVELMDFTNAVSGDSASLLPGDVGVTRYQIIQPLPFFGKRDLKGQVAKQRAAQRDAVENTVRLDVESSIKTAYARYYEAAGRQNILNETRELYEGLEKQVTTRYGVGLVPQQDVLQAQSEITAIKVDLIEAERRRREAAALLNALLPRDTDAPLAEPRNLPDARTSLSLHVLVDDALGNAPELAGERANIAAALSAQALTRRDRYPDFALGLRDTRPRNGTETWDVILQMTIPLQQSARRNREAESDRLLEAANASLQATRARIEGKLGETFAAFESNRDKARLLRTTLLPQAQATMKAAEAGYETGQVNFNTLIEAERQILRARLSLLDAEVEAAVQLAKLEQLTGGSL